ncbi:hypothetical protein DICSQDRAFT_157655 [Dichomitus squalens LYAD-421 SS1]|uniref:Uncharacterized protein n=1 Tax=Dichomitus squalens (strain LYAD-421) TaxID=732165 RepID=R7SLE4_DICSQ|nr:uncharacterized protein DICSQDRAFT_157655 [Dichomitus squalens LYAD-421 SS1]EJF56964.1 hypothetical protein DICSQDRAFT_157655 [Dichomitus squalens LYAD-421 SS1]
MKAFCFALVSAAIAATSYASLLPRDQSFCTDAKTVSTTTIAVGDKEVELTQLSCGTSVTKRQTATPIPNICGEICQNVCSDSGNLPPTTEDCQTIVDAITILNGSVCPTFTVDPNHVQTITFGTCRFFFENLGPDPLTYCWLDFVQIASAAASQCLPPTQPVLSEGLCIARDSTWEVGYVPF